MAHRLQLLATKVKKGNLIAFSYRNTPWFTGGFSPPISNPYEAMELIMEAIHKSGYHDSEIKLGMDCAASEFFDQNTGHYNLGFKMNHHIKEQYSEKWLERTPQEMMQLYHELAAKYPLITIEDPFHEEAWEDFAKFTKECPHFNCLQVIGDDLLCTNIERIKKAKEYNACNCLLLKLNQIGTVSEAIEAAKLAKSYGWNIMVSHRSGETEDHYIADLAVGLGVGQIKSGAPCRSERLAKYNQLLRIEEHMGKDARYPCGVSLNFGHW